MTADEQAAIDLLRALVRVPSRGGVDPYEPVIEVVEGWLAARGLPHWRLLDGQGSPVGLACRIEGARRRPHLVLDACLDTAPFGEAGWSHPPTSAAEVDGWLYGRGAADSKAAVAIFAVVGARLWAERAGLPGTVTLLFDADEHTGRFGGALAFFDRERDVDGVLIGYPGLDEVVVGGRGVLRAEVVVTGVAAHSGSRRPATANAVVLAARLVARLDEVELPGPDPAFGPPPKVTVTAIDGGHGYSVVPDRCRVLVDVRLTPSFARDAAVALLDAAAATLPPGAAEVAVTQHWPAYRLGQDAPVRLALIEAANLERGREVPAVVAGPANIGNYLAGLGIPATAGFGVRYEGLHAADERIDLATVAPVLRAYDDAIRRLLSEPPGR